ncbi:MAG: hypothetical protein EHM60_13120, partial [Lysobacterales bacterium]
MRCCWRSSVRRVDSVGCAVNTGSMLSRPSSSTTCSSVMPRALSRAKHSSRPPGCGVLLSFMYCRRRRTRCTFSARFTIWKNAENARISSRASRGSRPWVRTASRTASSAMPWRRPIAARRSPSTDSYSASPPCSFSTRPTSSPRSWTSSRRAASFSGKKMPLRAMAGADASKPAAALYVLPPGNVVHPHRTPGARRPYRSGGRQIVGYPPRWYVRDATRARGCRPRPEPNQGDCMNPCKYGLFALAAAHGASLLAVPSVLEAAPASGQIEEIVVTARQREERIEDVPVTIRAFTAADIRAAGIERPQDFIALTPGVSQVQTAEAGDLQVNIRGINTARDAETNFALVVDGVLQTNPNALNQELANVTQIEVLKGPQGALYGRNAVAGAFILTTRKPGDEWGTELVAGYGSDSSYRGSIYTGGPLTDDVKGSISAYTRKTDGQWNNITVGCDDCVDYFEETGVQGRLLFGLAGGEMDFKAKYSQIESGAINFNASIALADVAPFFGAAFYADPNRQNFRYINNVEPENEQENVNLSLKGEWDLDF